MLVSRRKRKENKKIRVYLNNKPLDQVTKRKYFGIILDHNSDSMSIYNTQQRGAEN